MTEAELLWVWPLRRGETLANRDWIEWHVHRFLESSFVAHCLADDRRGDIGTAVILWSASYRQDPAGTLPDDDVQLAQLARFPDVASWRAVRGAVLHGWRPVHVEGAEPGDGPRLGHPLIAGIVERSYRRKAANAQAGRNGLFAQRKHRVKVALEKIEPRLARNDHVVVAVTRYLQEGDLRITAHNIREALVGAKVLPPGSGRIRAVD